MKLNFAKMNPTRNMTIIVTDPVPRKKQAAVAAQLMAYGSVGAEQVGFREEASLPGARVRLQMMGGEFCGNASMSMAALLAFEDGLEDGASAVYPLEVSGAEGLVNCRIARRGQVFFGTVDMPLPEKICEMELFGLRCPVLAFPGIIHALVPENCLSPAAAEESIAACCVEMQAEAMGILLINEDMIAFRPLVYVRETGSAVWEQGCGSGTAAIGAYAAAKRGGDADLKLSQPGGRMQVQAEWKDGAVRRIQVSGEVRVAAMGAAWIEDC